MSFNLNDSVKEITSYDEIDLNKNAVITFAAPGCGHCKNQIKTLNKVCSELDSKVDVCYVVNAASKEGFEIGKQFNQVIRGVPTNLVCSIDKNTNMKTCSSNAGALPENMFKELLRSQKFKI